MAKAEQSGKEAFDKKAAKRAEKQRKKEEKMKKKAAKKDGNVTPGAEEENEGGIGSKIAMAFITFVIVVVWLGIFALLIKLDVGGFGSTVLRPILKDVPYINQILPKAAAEEEEEEKPVVDVQYPYETLEDAIDRIKELEVELSQALEAKTGDGEKISQLQAEIERLQEFENERAKFQEEKTKFYQEVVYSDQAPDIQEYKAYYESIDAANAAELYKQVIQDVAYDEELNSYVNTYSSMKPKQAAAILEQMGDNMTLVTKILQNMEVEARGNILQAMDAQFAAQVTKLMEPKKP
ncbi:MAG: hypothetical protein HFI76_09255 [Lachnospiraceae bacterium]|jgi:flagellar motility protein MotE (MotC chaperone)|nr:hypothetical protein [Lachnospiraceae bacterium]